METHVKKFNSLLVKCLMHAFMNITKSTAKKVLGNIL